MRNKLLLIMLMVFVTRVTVTANTGYMPDMYAQCTRVTEIFETEDPETELVYVVNCNGQEYGFLSDVGDWDIGDCAVCIFYGNGTEIVTDDEIISAKYDRPDLLWEGEVLCIR